MGGARDWTAWRQRGDATAVATAPGTRHAAVATAPGIHFFVPSSGRYRRIELVYFPNTSPDRSDSGFKLYRAVGDWYYTAEDDVR